MNSLVVYGLNYRSCPVAIRERFTIPESCLEHALQALKNLPHISEAAVLSTCNRTEVYAVVSDIASGFRELESFFQSTRKVSDHEGLKADFRLLHDDVALHLFRVASGLDSMVLGEGQIMSQVKAAHQAALKAGSAGPIIDFLFKSALNCGKKVRTETGLSKRAVSISSAAVELTRKLLHGLESRSILVIGAGRMGQICIKLLLAENNSCRVLVSNRNENKIKAVQASNTRYLDRLQIVNFEQRYKAAANCDAVVIATSSKNYILCREELTVALSRKSEPNFATDITAEATSSLEAKSFKSDLHIIDMSVPRNADPELSKITGVNLHNCDDLEKIVQHNLSEREALTKDAETIIFANLQEFIHWLKTLHVAPIIAELRGKVENIRLSYLQQKTSKQLDNASRVIVNQILHKPTIRLKSMRDYRNLQQQIEALQSLFDLSPLEKPSGAEVKIKDKS